MAILFDDSTWPPQQSARYQLETAERLLSRHDMILLDDFLTKLQAELRVDTDRADEIASNLFDAGIMIPLLAGEQIHAYFKPTDRIVRPGGSGQCFYRTIRRLEHQAKESPDKPADDHPQSINNANLTDFDQFHADLKDFLVDSAKNPPNLV